MMRAIVLVGCFIPGSAMQTYPSGKHPDGNVRACVAKYADGLDAIKPNLSLHSIRDHPLTAAATSNRPIIIAPGSGTTATRSLHVTLGKMGLCGWHCGGGPTEQWTNGIRQNFFLKKEEGKAECHARLRSYDYTKLPEHVQYIADTPIAEVFFDLFLAFPNASFILTTRPSLEWAKRRKEFDGGQAAPIQEPCGVQGGDSACKEFSDMQLAKIEDLKNELITCLVPKERLLTFSVFSDPPERIARVNEEIAAFLAVKVQNGAAYPHIGREVKNRMVGPNNNCKRGE